MGILKRKQTLILGFSALVLYAQVVMIRSTSKQNAKGIQKSKMPSGRLDKDCCHKKQGFPNRQTISISFVGMFYPSDVKDIPVELPNVP